MGKRKEAPTARDSLDDSLESPSKRHKKHKKHKHKRKHDESFGVELSGDPREANQPAIKLKIKLGGQTIGNKSFAKEGVKEGGVQEEVAEGSVDQSPSGKKIKGNNLVEGDVFKTKKKGDDTSDEEKEWLQALEAGELDDNGELSKKKDPLLLTARQRSLLHGGQEDSLLELPCGYKQPEMTEEQLEKKQQRAKKRREQAQEKREKDKKTTLERLLKKQDAKSKGGPRGKGSRRTQIPGFRYTDNKKGIYICVPDGLQFPYQAKGHARPKPVMKCGVAGCNKPKKYSCSKTGAPLCSLDCYKQNLATFSEKPGTVHSRKP